MATKAKPHGLLWDTEAGCVSIPVEKIQKALGRVTTLLSVRSTTKTAIRQALGSLRHVATCSRPARAFFQRLQAHSNLLPRFGSRKLTAEAFDDLHRFRVVLQHPDRFNSVPVADLAHLDVPADQVFMDASEDGLCALEPSLRRYSRQCFSAHESQMLSINTSELRSAVLTVLHWGPWWQQLNRQTPLHAQFHIDNTPAMAWANKRASKHPTAQLCNRILSLAEFQYNIVCTAAHIPGKLNIMADAGSRAWSSTAPISEVWANLSASWLQDHVEAPFDNLSVVWAPCYSNTPWRTLPMPSTANTGGSGANLLTR